MTALDAYDGRENMTFQEALVLMALMAKELRSIQDQQATQWKGIALTCPFCGESYHVSFGPPPGEER